MASLSAWQHIYTNVEREKSPTRTSGFQTLYYSHDGLTKNDVAEIEERVFYVYSDYNPVKRVFFTLQSGKTCIGQVLPLEGRDVAGREGLYIAHTFIFDTDVFQASQINPLDLFQENLFITSPDAANGDASTGNIKPIEISVQPTEPTTSGWSNSDFRKLIQLGINHADLAKNKSALALIGSPKEIASTIRSILDYVPAEDLPQCSFDTFFERGGKLSFTYCWCVGFKNSPRQPIYALVDVDKKRIIEPGQSAIAVSSFGRWVDAMLKANRSQYVLDHKQDALRIGQYLDTPTDYSIELTSINPSLLKSVLDVNEAQVKTRLRKQIESLLPKKLANRVFDPFFAGLSTNQIMPAISKGFKIEDLQHRLFEVYEQLGFVSPPKEERQQLAELLETHNHEALSMVSLIWGGASWENPVAKWRIQSGLKEMNNDGYESFWNVAIPYKLVTPMDLLVEGKETLFTSLITKHQLLPIEEIPALIKTLVKSENVNALQLLAPYLKLLSKKQLKKVKKRTEGVAGISPLFVQTLELLES